MIKWLSLLRSTKYLQALPSHGGKAVRQGRRKHWLRPLRTESRQSSKRKPGESQPTLSLPLYLLKSARRITERKQYTVVGARPLSLLQANCNENEFFG